MTTKNQRALLVVCSLAAQGRKDLTWLYRGLEIGGVGLAGHVLGKLYAMSTTVDGTDVNVDSVVAAMRGLAATSGITALDAIWLTHGEPGALVFDNGDRVDSSAIADAVLAAGLPPVLRAMYSTACFGATHNGDWLRAGFRVVAGANKVNANSATEYPVMLQHWAGGDPFADCVSTADNPSTRWFWDQAARRMRFGGVDSRKIVAGDGSITINS